MAPIAKRTTLKHVLTLLKQAYGPARWKCWGRPLDVLIETILSQNTSNANSGAGFRQLRRRFPTWRQAADAPVSQVEKCIRISGLSKIKAPRIRNILRQVQQQDMAAHSGRHGARLRDPSLNYLRDMSPQEAYEHLLEFDGVGPKTAACVLLFCFNMPLFPVDTHILRIAIRLGLLPKSTPMSRAQEILTPLIPPRNRYAMHILLVAHGRKTCRAQSPRCEWCNLIDTCPFGRRRLKQS